MSRKKKSPLDLEDGEFHWNDDDFNLDSHGVEAPQREVFEMLAEMGRTPDEVNETIREKYTKYLERVHKQEKAATQALDAAVSWAPVSGVSLPPPVRVAADGSVVILQAGTEGGDVTLVGRVTDATGVWAFARVTVDQIEALFGDSGVEITAPPALKPEDWVDGWEEGLRLMDRYPWARLHPLAVHPEFIDRVRVAVEARLADVDPSDAEWAREKWERLLAREGQGL
jgi:hypothetical protein